MPTDFSLYALRESNPLNQPGSDESIEDYNALRIQIAASPVAASRRLPRLTGRRRLIALSTAAAAALSLAGVLP